jgi:hypothetical protein
MKSWVFNILWFFAVSISAYAYSVNNTNVVKEGNFVAENSIKIEVPTIEFYNDDGFANCLDRNSQQQIKQIVNLPEVCVKLHIRKSKTLLNKDKSIESVDRNEFEELETLDVPTVYLQIDPIQISNTDLNNYLNT